MNNALMITIHLLLGKYTTMKINYRILGLFVFIILSWGLGWPANKVGLAYASPVWYTAIRLLVGTATMMVFVGAVGKLKIPQVKDIPLILIIGLLQISIYILLANIGLAYLPAGRSSLLAYTTPLWVMPMAVFLFHEEAGLARWLGFGLGLGGLTILLSPWELNWSDANVIFGASMLLLASLCWAVSMMAVRYMKWTKTPLELIPWQLLVGAIPILISAMIKEPSPTIVWNMPLMLSLVYTGFLVTGLSYWSGVIINKELPTIIVSLGFLLVPVFSLTISGIFLHEQITMPTIAAMLMIIAGLACVVVNPSLKFLSNRSIAEEEPVTE
jgi:drug/metabolite transporter (DMT)-like permease